MGVKRANDPKILATIPEYDLLLKQTIPGKGNAWFRYNYDGYGEDNSGNNFNGTGRGRFVRMSIGMRGRCWRISGRRLMGCCGRRA